MNFSPFASVVPHFIIICFSIFFLSGMAGIY